MVASLGQVEERQLVRPPASGNGRASPNGTATKEIPYDFVANFPINGRPGDRHLEVFNISTDGAFVATSIAHSFEMERFDLFKDRWGRNQAVLKLDDWLDDVEVIVTGFLNLQIGDLIRQFLRSASNDPVIPVPAVAFTTTPEIWFDPRCLLPRCCGLRFKYSIVDSGSGRELQNLPVPNISGLGNADGDRPFRNFPKPMVFLPRSTIRIEVEEVSEGIIYAGGELSIVLHGYKVLGYGT